MNVAGNTVDNQAETVFTTAMTKTHEIASLTGSNKARLWVAVCTCGARCSGGYRKAALVDFERHLPREGR